MNRYDRYPGDYLRDTLVLSLAQDGAYTRLLDWYYSTEQPIEDATKFAVTRCASEEEREVTQWVLVRFFEFEPSNGGRWIHARAEQEIAKAAPRIAAAKNNGKRGGRPPRKNPVGNPTINPAETHAGEGEGGGVFKDPSSGVGVAGGRSSPPCSPSPSPAADLRHPVGSAREVARAEPHRYEPPPDASWDEPTRVDIPTPPAPVSGTRRSEPPQARTLADRAAEIVQRDADRTWVSFQAPQKWPEVVAIAEALAAAEGRPTPALGPYHTDPGVRAVVGILASGASVETICAALPRVVADEWWQRERPSMRALSIDRIRAAQGPAPAPISRLNPKAKELNARLETDIERIRQAAERDAAGLTAPDPIMGLLNVGRNQ